MNVQVQDKIKVLIAGYSAEGHTSYGSQIRELWKRLARTGTYEIVQHGWFHTAHVEKVPWEIIPTNFTWADNHQRSLTKEDRWGQQSYIRILQQTKPHMVFTLADVYMVDHLAGYRNQFGYAYVQHLAIDGTPSPLRYEHTLNNASLTVAMSEFGADAMEKLTGRKPPVMMLGVDTGVFYPYPKQYRKRIRAQALPQLDENAFVIGWIGKDQTRKQPYNLFEVLYYMRSGDYMECKACGAVTRDKFDKMTGRTYSQATECGSCGLKELQRGEPVDAYMWCHAYNQPQQAYDFEDLIRIWQLTGKVIFTNSLTRDRGLTTKEVADLYNCFDVYASFSGGEGFGIPLIEAQACGIPVVYTDYSAQAEISRSGGLAVKVRELVPEPITNIDRAVTDIDHALEQLLRVYRDTKLKDSLGARGRAAMLDDFNYDEIAQQWDTMLKETMVNRVQMVGISS